MGEWILSSCVLIGAVIAVRYLFRGKISLRLQYALWGLVLLRLLLPISFGSSSASVANLPSVLEQQPAVQNVMELADTQITVQSYEEAYAQVVARHEAQGQDVSGLQGADLEALEYEAYAQMKGDTVAEILGRTARTVWLVGMAVVAAAFATTNLLFWRKLRRSRRKLESGSSELPVYTVRDIDTACLFGILHPAIYVTEEAAEEATVLRHAVAHETTHYRHGDHVWSVLRVVCLAVHWYNPLVWWTAFLSQRDGELACDEATIQQLGEAERAAYGRTLIEMTCRKRTNLLLSATTMTASKGGIKERIRLIAKKPRMAVVTLVIVLLIALTVVGCTFPGPMASGDDPEDTVLSETTPTETTYNPNSLTEIIGGTPPDAVTVCDVADLEGKDVTYRPEWYVRTSLIDPQYLAEVGEWIKRNLELNQDAVLAGKEGCFISVAQMTYFRIDDASCSTAFLCYLFTEDMEPAGEILFNDWGGQLVHNGPVMYESDSSKFNLSVMMENPDREYILLTNGYNEMLLDEYNEGYAPYGKTFAVEGDYFHALDWKTIAVSYNEIVYPGDLIWISLVTSEMIREAAGQGADALIPYLPYVDGADYERKYGSKEVFALMDLVKQWVIREPSPSRMKTAMTDIRWVDGAYADYYGIMLTDLFEVNKSVFAKVCLNDLPEDDEQLILFFIAYDWEISVEQAKARLKAELE